LKKILYKKNLTKQISDDIHQTDEVSFWVLHQHKSQNYTSIDSVEFVIVESNWHPQMVKYIEVIL